jgi:hypothetical protein
MEKHQAPPFSPENKLQQATFAFMPANLLNCRESWLEKTSWQS